MAKVQLTLFTDPVEVPDDEVAILRGQGLVVDDSKPPAQSEQDKAIARAAADRAAQQQKKES